jgi:hypothetical protein
MGARGREWVLREADRSVAFRRYRNLLRDVAGDGRATARPRVR